MWSDKFLLDRNNLLQSSQTNGFSPVCELWCKYNSVRSRKPFATYFTNIRFFTPACFSHVPWSTWLLVANRRGHWSQIHNSSSSGFLCIFICSFNKCNVEETCPHLSHVKTFSSVWNFTGREGSVDWSSRSIRFVCSASMASRHGRQAMLSFDWKVLWQKVQANIFGNWLCFCLMCLVRLEFLQIGFVANVAFVWL